MGTQRTPKPPASEVPDPSATAPIASRRDEVETSGVDVADLFERGEIFDDSRLGPDDIPPDDGVLRHWDADLGRWVASDGLDEITNTYDVGKALKAAGAKGFDFPEWASDDEGAQGADRLKVALVGLAVLGIVCLLGAAALAASLL